MIKMIKVIMQNCFQLVSPDQNGLGIGQNLLVKFENQVREKRY